ncbi:hypothetical protein CASFOL_024344 [Castilleja foliolosa]|uniref:Uncharacterized protein n=1 Tax=Castilleja foliolosa TaxID=1961234 RepID=A0ABD3CRK3_9LAMI
MENEGSHAMSKRMKLSADDKDLLVDDESIDLVPVEENESRTFEQVKIEISHILEKINNFTEIFDAPDTDLVKVSELLESGKSMLKELSNDFEERMISVHKEQILKWQEEIKELRSFDAANEDADALLQNAKYMLQNVHGGSLCNE